MIRIHHLLLFLSALTALQAQDRTVTVQVSVKDVWTRTGIILNSGATIVIQASGSIEAVPPSDTRALFHRVPPEGRSVLQGNKPQPTMRALAMLGKIGDAGPVWEAGSQMEIPVGDTYGTGELLLGINDDFVGDNTGSWTARITIRNNGFVPQVGRGGFGGRGGNFGNNVAATNAITAKEREFASFFGAPISEIRATQDGTGRFREYRNGAIYWHPATGAFEVHGGIREKWISLGAESGSLGYPVSDEYPEGNTRVSRFQYGAIIYDQSTGNIRVESIRR